MSTKPLGRSYRVTQSKDGKPKLERVNRFRSLPDEYRKKSKRKWVAAK
jgi:hypothetical protein